MLSIPTYRLKAKIGQGTVLKPVLPTQPHFIRSSSVGHSLQLIATTRFVMIEPNSPGISIKTKSCASVACASPQ